MTVCAACAEPICDHPDLIYSGVAVLDNKSPSGSWRKHIRETQYMRCPALGCDHPHGTACTMPDCPSRKSGLPNSGSNKK